MKRLSIILTTFMICSWTGAAGWAQAPADEAEPPLRTAEELDWLLAPIALYPDPLLAQMLPAATLPGEIVLAARYVNGGGDTNLIDEQSWDPCIKALARYPVVLSWMDENLNWTVDIGKAFLFQPADVMESIQWLRAQAQAAGNLAPGPQINVYNDQQAIEILPVESEVVYLPVYDTDVVYIHRSYDKPFVSWGIPLRIGPWLNHDFDWPRRNLMVWHQAHPRPAGWWSCRPVERQCPADGRPSIWHRRGHNRPEPEASVHPGPSPVRGGGTFTVINSPSKGGGGAQPAVSGRRGTGHISASGSSKGVVRIGASRPSTQPGASANKAATVSRATARSAPVPAPARR